MNQQIIQGMTILTPSGNYEKKKSLRNKEAAMRGFLAANNNREHPVFKKLERSYLYEKRLSENNDGFGERREKG